MFSFGPLLAALLTIGATEREPGLLDWFRRMRRFRGPIRFYVAAAVIPATIALASAALAVLAGAEMPAASKWIEQILPTLLLILPAAIVFGPVGEELAFRGWAQYRLQAALSPLVAALAIGLGVLAWHLPVLVRGDIPWPVMLALPAVSVVYAWLYRMSGTIWTVVMLHAVHNGVSGLYIGGVFDGQAGVLRLGILAALYGALVAYIIYHYGPSLDGSDGARARRRRASAAVAG
jgi:membrane protease YdiL (CAAX protease family)